MTIFSRINKVMKEVKYVKTDKKVSGGGANYNAVTNEQLLSVVRQSMVDNGIICYPEQVGHEMLITRDLKNDVKMSLYSGDYIIHFVAESSTDEKPDRTSVPINAQASDNGDKAPGKCVTYATKQAMRKMFALETGDDEESRGGPDLILPEQVAEIEKMLHDTGSSVPAFLGMLGIDQVCNMPASQLGKALSKLNRKIALQEAGK